MEKILSLPKGTVELLLGFADADGYETVKDELGDQWRWGYWHTLIIKDSEGNFWAHDYQEQTGDNYWNSISGDGFNDNYDRQIQFYRVIPTEVVTIVYREA